MRTADFTRFSRYAALMLLKNLTILLCEAVMWILSPALRIKLPFGITTSSPRCTAHMRTSSLSLRESCVRATLSSMLPLVMRISARSTLPFAKDSMLIASG